jgi:hypothetical protein
VVLIVGFSLALAVAYFLVGRGLRSLASWARPTSILASVSLLIAIPVGTLFGALILFFVLKADRYVFSRTYREIIEATDVENTRKKENSFRFEVRQ